ncbi:unnamed protein product [Amoebophrya sp. A120]|nr:unnamed protein product [Amoebophrya sp. A120]|eukprot:GSA120T00007333001.1
MIVNNWCFACEVSYQNEAVFPSSAPTSIVYLEVLIFATKHKDTDFPHEQETLRYEYKLCIKKQCQQRALRKYLTTTSCYLRDSPPKFNTKITNYYYHDKNFSVPVHPAPVTTYLLLKKKAARTCTCWKQQLFRSVGNEVE